MTKFPKIIQDGDIELVKLEPTFENAQRAFELIDRNRAHLGRWEFWPAGIKNAEGQFNALVKKYDDADGTFWILYKGELAGSAGIRQIDPVCKSGNIGYWLGAEFTGRGIATRAAKTLEDLAFGTMDFNRLAIIMDDENKKSVAVAQRLGYKLDGIMRDDSLRSDGTIGNSCVYSKLKREWQSEEKKIIKQPEKLTF